MRAVGINWFAALLAVSALGASPALSQQAEVEALQRLLNNAGYNVGTADGAWGGKTRAGLEQLSAAAGLTLILPAGKPSADEAARLLAAATAWLQSEMAAFAPGPMPEDYFWGTNAEWFRNIHAWSVGAIIQANGKDERFTVPRFGHLIPSDLDQFRAVGVPVVRMHVNFDGMVLGLNCFWGYDVGYPQANECYDAEYRKASRAGWKPQTEALATFKSNPGIKLYIDSVKAMTEAGFHVLVAPNDFFWGNGADWTNATADPLLHRYLDSDSKLREFYARWVGALVAALREEGVANFRLQSLNEPRWCNNLAKWKAFERSVFDAARRVSPTLQLVSSAACTSADQHMAAGANSYRDALAKLVPIHADLDNVVYSIHMRLPRLLFIGADHYRLKDGTMIAYPHETIPASAGLDRTARYEIGRYDELEPDRQFFADAFADIGAFAKENGVRVIVTEWGVSKADYGVSHEDRLELFKDFGDAAKANGVATIYGEVFEKSGFGSAPHRPDMPDHRFDPAIMSEIARMNDAPPYDPATADIGDGLPDLVASLAPIFAELQTAIDALRPKFDFSGFTLATRYDGFDCQFNLLREEEGYPNNDLAQGRFRVAGGKIGFYMSGWRPNLHPAGAIDPIRQADLGITEKGQLAGMVDLFVMFSEAGEFYPARQFILKPAKGNFDHDSLLGDARFAIDNWMTAIFRVSNCR
jgi:hypothetical protein